MLVPVTRMLLDGWISISPLPNVNTADAGNATSGSPAVESTNAVTVPAE
jgi:hypothetical protein